MILLSLALSCLRVLMELWTRLLSSILTKHGFYSEHK